MDAATSTLLAWRVEQLLDYSVKGDIGKLLPLITCDIASVKNLQLAGEKFKVWLVNHSTDWGIEVVCGIMQN